MSALTLGRAIRMLDRSRRTRGTVGTVLATLAYPYYWLRQREARRIDELVQSREREFDRRFGVETARFLKLRDTQIQSRNWVFGHDYAASPADLFNEIIGRLVIKHRDFVFVDFGSGKGRTLLLASEFGFKYVVGVEFSSELHEQALRNVQAYTEAAGKPVDIRCVLGDALDYELPDDPLVCYFFNPFSRELMGSILQRIKRSAETKPREIVVAYLDRARRGYESSLDVVPNGFTAVFEEAGFLTPLNVAANHATYASTVLTSGTTAAGG